MKYPAFKFAATITSLLLVAGLVGQLLFNSKPPPEEVAEAVLGNARNLKIVYQQWITQAKQNGADRNLVLALSYIKVSRLSPPKLMDRCGSISPTEPCLPR